MLRKSFEPSTTTKQQKRQSRLQSPSEFERMLNSNDTTLLTTTSTSREGRLGLLGEGEEEDDQQLDLDTDDASPTKTGNGNPRTGIPKRTSTPTKKRTGLAGTGLGYNSIERPSSSSLISAAAGTTPTRPTPSTSTLNAPRPPPLPAPTSPSPSTSHDLKRRSIHRSVGTASSPDLASLVRKAREASPVPSTTTTPTPDSPNIFTTPPASATSKEDSTELHRNEEEERAERPSTPKTTLVTTVGEDTPPLAFQSMLPTPLVSSSSSPASNLNGQGMTSRPLSTSGATTGIPRTPPRKSIPRPTSTSNTPISNPTTNGSPTTIKKPTSSSGPTSTSGSRLPTSLASKNLNSLSATTSSPPSSSSSFPPTSTSPPPNFTSPSELSPPHSLTSSPIIQPTGPRPRQSVSSLTSTSSSFVHVDRPNSSSGTGGGISTPIYSTGTTTATVSTTNGRGGKGGSPSKLMMRPSTAGSRLQTMSFGSGSGSGAGSPEKERRSSASGSGIGGSPTKLEGLGMGVGLGGGRGNTTSASIYSNATGSTATTGTFQSTMRKTSRFFKKFGGGPSTASSISNPTSTSSSNASGSNFRSTPSSAPTTPSNSSFPQSQRFIPPVPEIPSSFNSRIVPTSSPSRKPSVDITIQRPPSLPRGDTIHVTGGGGAGGGHSRKRSMSWGAGVMERRGSSRSGGSSGGGGGGGGGAEESERLRNELQRWQLDVDGVLGSISDGPPKLSPNLSTPPPPTSSSFSTSISTNGNRLTKVSSAPIPSTQTPLMPLPNFAPLDNPFSSNGSLEGMASAGTPGSSPTMTRTRVGSNPNLAGTTTTTKESRRPTWDGSMSTAAMVAGGTAIATKRLSAKDINPTTTTGMDLDKQTPPSPPTLAAAFVQGEATAPRSFNPRRSSLPVEESPVGEDRTGGKRELERSGETQEEEEEEDPDHPSVRLVTDDPTTPQPATSPPSTSAPTSPAPDLEISPRKGSLERRFSAKGTGADAVSNSLATIDESHARERSAGVRTPTPTGTGMAPPIVFTSSPSPATAVVPSPNSNGNVAPGPNRFGFASTTPSSAFDKKLARQSVVAYPGPATGTRMGTSLPTSRAGSTTSLTSVPSLTGKRRGGGAGGGSEEDLDGVTLEERARICAERCWNEDEAFLDKKKIAEWLGSTGKLNVAALYSYMDNFDFTGLRLDLAFRRLCEKLYLKAETQQVDRIIEQFSRRFTENNPKTVYGSAGEDIRSLASLATEAERVFFTDVVHQITFALLLLNTDLHVVDTDTRMSRNKFVKNTLDTISNRNDDSSEVGSPALLFGSPRSDDSNSVFGGNDNSSRASLDRVKDSPNKSRTRLPMTSPGRNNSSEGSPSKDPFKGVSARTWEYNLESNLKEMYNAIKAQPVFQPLDGTDTANQSTTSLTPGGSNYSTWSGVSRSTSRRSATSTVSGGSSMAFKRSSVRGFGGFLGTSSAELLRSSSPTPSTATSLSDDNLSTAFGAASSSSGSHHHHSSTIGFANTLSHSIIREQQEDDAQSEGDVVLTDEELALLGAPWAKEGILTRKHYWEAAGKRSKEKNWLQVFVVISKGEMRMFRFDGAGSTRTGSRMGGGDWSSNASNVGEISLAHALCSAMPPPGYSRDRPHCFVLTLPGGGSYFFQAGTQDLVGEWVATCNYWAARQSKETGRGVSNMEYGWNRVETSTHDDDFEEIASIRSGKSGRSSHSKISYHGSIAPSLSGNPNDRINISEWKVPAVPTAPSTLSEEAQLESLQKQVSLVRTELAEHNALRSPMSRLYSPRSANVVKAQANWDRRSQHLLSEVVKFQCYVDALRSALKLRALKRGQKEVEVMLQAADDIEDLDPVAIDAVGPAPLPNSSSAPALAVLLPQSAETNEVERTHLDDILGGSSAMKLRSSMDPSEASAEDTFYDPTEVAMTPTSTAGDKEREKVATVALEGEREMAAAAAAVASSP